MRLVFVYLVGWEYVDADKISDEYAGEYDSDEEFAQDMAEQLDLIKSDLAWPYTCIDWEYAARELMWDYHTHNNYYFRNT